MDRDCSNNWEVLTLRNKANSRRKFVLLGKQSQHTPGVSVWQEKPLAISAAKKDTTETHVNRKATMPRLIGYRHNQQQHNTKTAFWGTTQQCISVQMSTASRLQSSKALIIQSRATHQTIMVA